MPLGSAMETTPAPGVGWPQDGRLPVGDKNVPPNIQMLLEMLMNRPPVADPALRTRGAGTGLDTIGRPGYR